MFAESEIRDLLALNRCQKSRIV